MDDDLVALISELKKKEAIEVSEGEKQKRINEAEGQAVAGAIGDSAIFLRLDVTDEEGWKSVIASTLDAFGRLDILVKGGADLLACETMPSFDEIEDRYLSSDANAER